MSFRSEVSHFVTMCYSTLNSWLFKARNVKKKTKNIKITKKRNERSYDVDQIENINYQYLLCTFASNHSEFTSYEHLKDIYPLTPHTLTRTSQTCMYHTQVSQTDTIKSQTHLRLAPYTGTLESQVSYDQSTFPLYNVCLSANFTC